MAAVIFNNVSRARLSRKVRLTLDVLRAELFQLSGDLRSGLDTLGQTDWRSEEPSELAKEAQRLSGDFEDALGQFDHALANYADSLATGKPAFDFYQQINHTHGTAATACNLAEASCELGDEAEAERYVGQ